MYIDEDGDIAHEFYVETKIGSKLTLKRISNQHLKPQVSLTGYYKNYLYIIFLELYQLIVNDCLTYNLKVKSSS